MRQLVDRQLARTSIATLVVGAICFIGPPRIAMAQSSSPFMTGATSLQTNILAWLTPVAIILIMALGGMAMANRISQVTGTYHTEAQTLVENCGNTLILRCSGSDHGGTAHFASRLIGEREIVRRITSRGSDRSTWAARNARRSKNTSEQHVTELAVMPSELEQLPDLSGYLKTASSRQWLRVSFPQQAANRRFR